MDRIISPASGGAKHLKLEWAEMEERHRLTFEIHEEYKLSFEDYLSLVVFYKKQAVHARPVSAFHVRAIYTLPRHDRDDRSAQSPVRTEDRRCKQRIACAECVSDSRVSA